jgi:hypothetical protein
MNFATVAKKLASGNTEGEYRSAISRLYYAVLHHFREFLEAHEINLGLPDEADGNLKRILANSGPGLVEIAKQVEELRLNRVLSDYRCYVTMGIGTWSKSLQLFDGVIGGFESIINDLPATELAERIKQYLGSIGQLQKPW